MSEYENFECVVCEETIKGEWGNNPPNFQYGVKNPVTGKCCNKCDKENIIKRLGGDSS